MSEDFENEIEAVNSIYGDGSLVSAEEDNVYILHLPDQSISLRIHFPARYPAEPPAVLGIQTSGEHARKGYGTFVVDEFRDTLGRLFKPGEVCLFDVIEEVNATLASAADFPSEDTQTIDEHNIETVLPTKEAPAALAEAPAWVLSDVVVEMKSVFIARCARVSSPDQAQLFLEHLLDSDKKVRSATHNITAWRIRGQNGVVFQDCDDDGETAAGGRVLHLLQLMDVWDVMVVVTRWYGGHQLGPKRFSIINTVARDACVKGNFLIEETNGKKKGKH